MSFARLRELEVKADLVLVFNANAENAETFLLLRRVQHRYGVKVHRTQALPTVTGINAFFDGARSLGIL